MTDNQEFYKLDINHCGGKNHKLSFPQQTTCEDLVNKIETTLECPRYQLKIIYRGKQIYDDPNILLKDIYIQPAPAPNKLMVIGKKNSAEEEKILKDLVEMLKSSQNYESEVQEKKVQFQKSIVDGFVTDQKDKSKILDEMTKRLKFIGESQMKFLMKLDMMEIKKEFEDAKRARKNSVVKIQKWLDETDKFIAEVEGKE